MPLKGWHHSGEYAQQLRAYACAPKSDKWHESIQGIWTNEKRARAGERSRAAWTDERRAKIAAKHPRKIKALKTDSEKRAASRAGWTPEARAAAALRMKARWATNPPLLKTMRTKIELEVERQLVILGHRYVAQYPLGGRLFDFALPSLRVLIEVDGCYWHACPKCNHNGVRPGAKEVDAVKDLLARSRGWKLIRVPEHAVADGSHATLLREALEASRGV